MPLQPLKKTKEREELSTYVERRISSGYFLSRFELVDCCIGRSPALPLLWPTRDGMWCAHSFRSYKLFAAMAER